jgi:hypothetical protein
MLLIVYHRLLLIHFYENNDIFSIIGCPKKMARGMQVFLLGLVLALVVHVLHPTLLKPLGETRYGNDLLEDFCLLSEILDTARLSENLPLTRIGTLLRPFLKWIVTVLQDHQPVKGSVL